MSGHIGSLLSGLRHGPSQGPFGWSWSISSPIYSGAPKSPIHRTLSMLGLAAR